MQIIMSVPPSFKTRAFTLHSSHHTQQLRRKSRPLKVYQLRRQIERGAAKFDGALAGRHPRSLIGLFHGP
jgi:hypothetical protein